MTRVVLENMFNCYFVDSIDSDLGVKVFFEKTGSKRIRGCQFSNSSLKHLGTLALRVEENFMKSLSAHLLIFIMKKKIRFQKLS